VIRVGFVINLKNNEWLGGVNYYRNLISAIGENPERKIEPVIITGYDSDNTFLSSIPALPIIKDHIFDSDHPYTLLRPIIQRLMRRDIVQEHYLKNLMIKNDIPVLSHSGSLGKSADIRTIGWIPDFQHKHLPDFFSKSEVAGRDKIFRILCAECNRVIFSSNAAKSDAEKSYPEYAKKFRVLHFATTSMDLCGLPDFTVLKEKYQITGPYFIVPNQFWAHKNHMVILEALNLLRSQNHPVTVIATGNTSDYRKPDYFKTLGKKIQDYQISDNFKIIGIVPYKELLQLMIHANAVINPSLFEGWSTAVEEAKALNLKIILSDIPVHREQNPENGIFFPPHDPDRLADILRGFRQEENSEWDENTFSGISRKLKDQQRIFAQNYERIVLDMLEENSRVSCTKE